MQEMIKMGSAGKYDEYYDWLDEYNADQTQPPENSGADELIRQFPEIGSYEAIQIIVSYLERSEKIEKGG